jgi:hypothetical protein
MSSGYAPIDPACPGGSGRAATAAGNRSKCVDLYDDEITLWAAALDLAMNSSKAASREKWRAFGQADAAVTPAAVALRNVRAASLKNSRPPPNGTAKSFN